VRVSVIIPFYNLAPYVRKCLDSVAAAVRALNDASRLQPPTSNLQPVSVEVICVDDGSTDDTGRILDGDAATGSSSNFNSPLQLRIVHKPNGGEGSARNAGLAVATGDWITYLDGDDLWLPNMLTEAVPLLAAQADANIVNLRFVPFEDGAVVSGTKAESPRGASRSATGGEIRVFDTSVSIADKVLLDVGVYPTFFRRSSLGGLRFGALPLGADRLFVAQCLARAKKVVMSDAVVHAYRVRAGSMARATWTSRKVMSQCDYASGALAALSASGKRIGPAGVSYLASLWLSDVPAHARRLRDREERRTGSVHWAASLDSAGGELLRGRQRFVLDLLRRFARHPLVACELAHALRALGAV